MAEAPTSLTSLVHQHNRRVVGEALITLGLGILTCVLVFGGVFWLSYLAFFLCFRGFAIGGPATSAAIITGVFLLISVWSAWRQIDPIAEAGIEVDDSPGRRVLEGMIGLSIGVPIVRREGLAGAAALLIGGPVNLFDAWSIWRTRLRAGRGVIADAQALLAASVKGPIAANPAQARAIGLLHRLHLVKAVCQADGRLALELTLKGRELASC